MLEKNSPFATRRAGDDFLRRMLEGERSCPVAPAMEQSPCKSGKPACPAPAVPECSASANHGMPSLAMVYSPAQGFGCLLSPSAALAAGTLFAELDKPFEGRSICRRTR